MEDINQMIEEIEKQQNRQLTEQERKVLEGFGEFFNAMCERQDNSHKEK